MHSMVLQDTPALVIDEVSKAYEQWQRSGKAADIIKNLIHPQKRSVMALDNISLTVCPGEFVAYAGANGAGKSTTIKILSGILSPSSGRVRVLGMDPSKERISLMSNIGVLFGQRTELWWDHPVITSFEWKKQVWNIPDETYQKNLELVTELLDLSDILHTFARELSLGQRMKADIAMLLLHSPSLIFLDEPTLGLDVLAKKRMIDFLKQINRELQTTIVVTSHDMDDLEEMAQRIVLLNKGHIAFDGSFETLRTFMGAKSRIRIITPPDSMALPLPGLVLEESASGIHDYTFNSNEISIHSIFEMLAAYPQIKDIEIGKAPIEDIIAALYTSWKQS